MWIPRSELSPDAGAIVIELVAETLTNNTRLSFKIFFWWVRFYE